MLAYILRRIAVMIPMLVVASIITFVIIQLPPGDYFTTLQAELAETGGGQDKAIIKKLQEIYGLDQPLHVQYLRWVSGWPRLDFGYSLGWNAPVWDVISSYLVFTLWLGFLSLVLWSSFLSRSAFTRPLISIPLVTISCRRWDSLACACPDFYWL